jgi:hypothetical protein
MPAVPGQMSFDMRMLRGISGRVVAEGGQAQHVSTRQFVLFPSWYMHFQFCHQGLEYQRPLFFL